MTDPPPIDATKDPQNPAEKDVAINLDSHKDSAAKDKKEADEGGMGNYFVCCW